MIKTVKVTNHLGESVELELKNPETSGFFVRGIEGLGPSKAVINTRESLSLDGSVFNSARATQRNVVFNLGFLEKPTIEDIRQKSYKYFPLKRPITIEIETDNRISKTLGYVESNEPNIFTKEEATLISVLCPDPYFYAIEATIINFSNTVNLFTFPFSNESLTENLLIFSELVGTTENNVYYAGDASTGFVMTVNFLGPVDNLTIYNLTTNETMGFDSDIINTMTGEGLDAGDKLIISTVKGNKYIHLERSGVVINVLNSLVPGSDWFQLSTGDNIFFYDAETGVSNLQFTIEYLNVYEGI